MRNASVSVGLSFCKLLLDLYILKTALQLVRRNLYSCIHCVEESVFIGLLCKFLFDIPVVYDMHSILSEQLRTFAIFRKVRVRRLLQKIEKSVLKHADSLIGSYGLAAYMATVEPGKSIHECWFASPTAASKNLDLAGKLGLNGHPLVVYAGNFAEYQGIDLLIDSAVQMRRRAPHVKFLLVGGTQEELLSLTRLIKRRRLTPSVRLIPRQPREAVQAFLSLADVLVLCRPRGLNAPLKIFSYLQAQKPIVATNIPAHLSVLNETTAVLVEPDPSSLTQGILSLLTDELLAARIKGAARAALKTLSKPLSHTLTIAYKSAVQMRSDT
jgi:glycosyltransferase involved in cell wall biosynthesis